MSGFEHLRDEIQDLLDGRLDETARGRVERHLEACVECRREWRALSAVKESVRAGLLPKDIPTDVASRVSMALEREKGPLPRIPIVVYASAAAALALILALAVFAAGRRNLPSRVARDYENHKAGILPLQLKTQNPQELDRLFAARGVAFPTRVFDLGVMGYRLEGGRVLNPDGRQRAFSVYRGPKNEILVCEMYEGRVEDLPKGGELRRHNGFSFFVFHRGRGTQVFWQEGKTACVLVSEIPSEEVVQLAFAKAMKA